MVYVCSGHWTGSGCRIKPKYTELCRRFLADDADFAEEALEKAGITRHFENDNLQKTVEEIAAFVLSYNG